MAGAATLGRLLRDLGGKSIHHRVTSPTPSAAFTERGYILTAPRVRASRLRRDLAGLAIRPYAPVPPRSAVRSGRDAAGDRTEERQIVRPPTRQATGGAGGRRAVPSAPFDPRPAFAPKNPRRGSGHDRDHRGESHGASGAAEPALARAVQSLGRGRHRRRRIGVLSRQSPMGTLAPAGRRDPMDFRQARDLRRIPPDRSSRPGLERGGIRKTSRRRAGLRPDRRACFSAPSRAPPRAR